MLLDVVFWFELVLCIVVWGFFIVIEWYVFCKFGFFWVWFIIIFFVEVVGIGGNVVEIEILIGLWGCVVVIFGCFIIDCELVVVGWVVDDFMILL